jgi:hypothetical protein
MNIIDDLFLLERLDSLIRSRSTGSPDELAVRLGVCKRNIHRLVGALKDQGLPVNYNKIRKTYYYSEKVFMEFKICVGESTLIKIKGGFENKLN